MPMVLTIIVMATVLAMFMVLVMVNTALPGMPDMLLVRLVVVLVLAPGGV